jgi:hypothetical protein
MMVIIFSNKVFIIKVCAVFFRHNAIAHRLQYSVNVTFICTGKTKKFVWLDLLRWYGTEPAISPRYACSSAPAENPTPVALP